MLAAISFFCSGACFMCAICGVTERWWGYAAVSLVACLFNLALGIALT